jgi:hypothetical protein
MGAKGMGGGGERERKRERERERKRASLSEMDSDCLLTLSNVPTLPECLHFPGVCWRPCKSNGRNPDIEYVHHETRQPQNNQITFHFIKTRFHQPSNQENQKKQKNQEKGGDTGCPNINMDDQNSYG